MGRKAITHRRIRVTEHFNAKPEKGKCRWCGELILDANGQRSKRRTWHPECVHIYNLATSGQYARQVVRRRDKGVCSSCGVDTVKLRKELDLILKAMPWRDRKSYLRSIGYLGPGRTLWQVDHKIPLMSSDGSDHSLFGIDNLVTLCLRCHDAKSKQDMENRRHGTPR